jgi:hypothetical protein
VLLLLLLPLLLLLLLLLPLLLLLLQEYELLAARERFMSGLQGLLGQRQRIEELLAASRKPKRSTHVDVLSASLSALDAYEDLKTNVIAEHQLHMEFVIFMFKNVSGMR